MNGTTRADAARQRILRAVDEYADARVALMAATPLSRLLHGIAPHEHRAAIDAALVESSQLLRTIHGTVVLARCELGAAIDAELARQLPEA